MKKYSSNQLNEILKELSNVAENGKVKASSFKEKMLRKLIKAQGEMDQMKNKIIAIDRLMEDVETEEKYWRKELEKFSKLSAIMEDGVFKNLKYREIYEKAEKAVEKRNNYEEERKTLYLNIASLEREVREGKSVLNDVDDLILTILKTQMMFEDKIQEMDACLGNKSEQLLLMVEVAEYEKKKVAREVHDGPAQTLSYISLETEVLRSQVKDIENEDIISKVDEIAGWVKGSITEVREIIYGLRPMQLDDVGVEATIMGYVEKIANKENICTTLSITGKDSYYEGFSQTLRLFLFRIIQECLNNIIKHSLAENVSIKIEASENMINLKITDDGKGFDVEEFFASSKKNEHFGLIGIKERVALIDGSFKISSEKGIGTEVKISLPKT